MPAKSVGVINANEAFSEQKDANRSGIRKKNSDNVIGKGFSASSLGLTDLSRIAAALEEIAAQQKRIAEHLVPQNRAVVGTKYIGDRLGVSTKWVGELIRKGEIPQSCICPKSGAGKYWRFWKEQIDQWIKRR